MKLNGILFTLVAASVPKLSSASVPGLDLSRSYAPVTVACPSNVQWVRPAKGLNSYEAEWVRKRKLVVLEEFALYLERLDLQDFNISSYLKTINGSDYANVPSLGLAISGGGWASAFTGTGALRALDARLPAAVEQRTGGLLQSLTYQAGLSGGGWPTMSFLAHDWPTADEIVDYWHPDILRPSTGPSTEYSVNVTSIFEDLGAKAEAGFTVTTADYFGRTQSYEFIPGHQGGLNVTLSNLVNIPAFKNHQAPFPILHLSTIFPDDVEFFGFQAPFSNASTYELTPYEFGAWQGDFSSFTPTQWLGTRLEDGELLNTSACVQGFDRVSLMMGSSASGINLWYIEDLSNGTFGTFSKRSRTNEHSLLSSLTKRQNNAVPLADLEGIIEGFNETSHENISTMVYSSWPNPFKGLNTTTPELRNAADLKIIDGSEGGQAIPLWGQIQPVRKPDFLIAWDDNEDARPYFWNNGTNLHDTYVAAKRAGIPFPVVPTAPTFIANNYTHRPVFFGCDTNLTTTKTSAAPIVLYLANAPYSAYSNYSFAQATTTRVQMNEIFVNSFNILTQGNLTLDGEWAQCLGCAAIDRSAARIGMQRTLQCERCMERYCWDGVSEPDKIAGPEGGRYPVSEIVDLEMVLNPDVSFAEWNATNPF